VLKQILSFLVVVVVGLSQSEIKLPHNGNKFIEYIYKYSKITGWLSILTLDFFCGILFDPLCGAFWLVL